MKRLGKDGLLEDVKFNLQVSNCNSGLPFQWNETLNQLQMRNHKEQKKLGLRLEIATVYFILALIKTFIEFNNSSLMVLTHCLFTFFCWALFLSCQYPNFLQIQGVVQLFNGFIQLEENFSKYFENSYVKHRQKSGLSIRGMIYLLTSAGIAGGIVFSLDILRNPCSPAYVGYWMSSQCEPNKPGYYLPPTWSVLEILTKVIIAMPAFVVWTPLLCGCCFQTALEIVVEGHCLRVNIAEFGRKILGTHKDNIRDSKKLTLFHRQIQIMPTHYRLYVSQFPVGFAIPSFIGLQTACLFNTISVISGKDTVGPPWYNFLYAYVAVVIFCDVIFVFGILADVFEVSKKEQEQIQEKAELIRNKWFKRWFRSCPNFRI